MPLEERKEEEDMNKQQFLNALAEALKKLPREERYRTLAYYDELIDDRVEDGQNEYAVVESMGSPADIARDLLGIEEQKSVKQYGKGAKAWIIVLLVLGFPIWGSLLLTAAILLLTVYILLYLPILILGALAVGFLGASLMGIVGAPFLAFEVGVFTGGLPAALFQAGVCVALLGLSLLCAVGLYHTTKGIVRASRSIWRTCTGSFRKMGRAI